MDSLDQPWVQFDKAQMILLYVHYFPRVVVQTKLSGLKWTDLGPLVDS